MIHFHYKSRAQHREVINGRFGACLGIFLGENGLSGRPNRGAQTFQAGLGQAVQGVQRSQRAGGL